jgi:AraC-like DNA-binding protein
MGVIAALIPTSGHAQRLRTAIRDRHQLILCEDWADLLRACDQQAVRVIVLDLFIGGRANFERIRFLKQKLPRATLIAYVTFAADRAHDLFDAGRQGMDALVLADQDDAPRALLALIEQAESKSLGAVVRAALDNVDAMTRDAVLLSVTRAHERLGPEALARLLALPRRTVSQRLAAAGFPPPQQLLTWGRLIVAAHLLEDQHRSADRIAAALDFPSASAFRNTCQRYLHVTPSEVRQRGGAGFVIRTLLEQVHASPETLAMFAEDASRAPVGEPETPLS